MSRAGRVRRPRRRITVALGLVPLLLTLSCALNPATGKRELNLMSESQEIALGREADPQIVAQFGLYPDDELQAYVDRLGRELAAVSERPELPWTFRVLDDPLVNAFALPGGFIYVTRGILAHLNSEAELVGVLGHEIGHVTARHSASQISRATLAQVGLGLGAVLAPEAAGTFGGLAETSLGLLFLKYGRDDERQADTLGLRYSVRGGYDPDSLVEVMSLLDRVSSASQTGSVPGWLSTHPAPENRGERLREQIAAQGIARAELKVERDAYLERLDGMVYGDDPRQGFFRDDTFYHPELAFQFGVPSGWKTANTRQAVLASSPEEDAILRLRLAVESSAAAAARAFFEPEALVPRRSWRNEINGLPTVSRTFEVRDSLGQVRIVGLVAFIEYDGRVYELLGYTREADAERYANTVTGSLSSFRPVTDRAVLEVEPQRIDLERLERPATLRDIEATVPADTLALLNNLEVDERLAPGTAVKRVVGGVR